MKVLVTTCDKYLPALRPFALLFNRYFGADQPVIVGGFTPPSFSLPPNFSFHSLGRQEDYPVGKWSNGVIKFLRDVNEEIVLLMLEDMWIVQPVNRRLVQVLYDYMRQFQYVAKMDLCADRLYAYGADLNYGHVKYVDSGSEAQVDLVKSMPGSPYHLSLMAGFWRTDVLLRHLVPNESPWDAEIIGTPRLSHDQRVIVLGTKQWPLKHTLAFRGGAYGKPNVSELNPEDVRELVERGWIETP